jgi:cytochrome c-type biogenesis protein
MQLSNFIISFAEGLLTFISPCLLPMLPVYIFYLAGVSDEKEISMSENKGRLLINSLGFAAGFTIVFVSLGAAATSLGQFLKSNSGIFAKISGIIIILFGLHFIGILKLNY